MKRLNKTLEYFTQRGPALALFCLNQPMSISQLQKNMDTTYSHVSKLIKVMLAKGLIERLPSDCKRIKLMNLTEKGKQIRDILRMIK